MPLPNICSKNTKTIIQRDLCPQAYCRLIHNSQELETTLSAQGQMTGSSCAV